MGAVPPPRKLMFMHIGGPYDGTKMPVVVDTVTEIGMPDTAIPSFAAVQSKQITNMYARNEQLGDDGFEYVYYFLAGNEANVNKKAA